MQSVHTKQLFILIGCIGITLLLLVLSIRIHNKTFFVAEQKAAQDTPSATLDVIPIFPEDPIEGTRNAPITIMGFEDFLCESCRVAHRNITDLLERYPTQVKFIWKDLSITQIPANSELVHIYGYCMHAQQRFSEYKAAIFSEIFTTVNDDVLTAIATGLGANVERLRTCTAAAAPREHLEKNKLLARALQIQRTPTFFVNGMQVPTPESVAGWEQLLQLTR